MRKSPLIKIHTTPFTLRRTIGMRGRQFPTKIGVATPGKYGPFVFVALLSGIVVLTILLKVPYPANLIVVGGIALLVMALLYTSRRQERAFQQARLARKRRRR